MTPTVHNEPVTSEILDHVPPNNPEAEKGVLGSIVLDPRMIDDVAPILRPDDFYADAHRKLYAHLLAMHNAGKRIDTILLTEALKQAGDFEAIGGAAYLAEVLYAVPVAAHAVDDADIVREKAVLRRLIHAATGILQDAYAPGADPGEVVRRVEAAIAQATETGRENGALDANPAVSLAVERARTARARKSGGGLAIGVADFDYQVGGLFPGELAILAARPRMGKTALATQIMGDVAGRGQRVLFVSLEMSAPELCNRLLCGLAGVSNNEIRTGRLTENDLARLEEAGNVFRTAAFRIDDRSAVSVADIRVTARSLQRKEGLALLVIDYLQRIQPADLRLRRHEQIGQITGASSNWPGS